MLIVRVVTRSEMNGLTTLTVAVRLFRETSEYGVLVADAEQRPLSELISSLVEYIRLSGGKLKLCYYATRQLWTMHPNPMLVAIFRLTRRN